ncbi:hypothetical protein SAMN05660236_1352 [Ohtaekwangia koreensis]|uniref:Uncharacterized protein n=1 Tax=Ohtaekwangia koreensis TaxID=688867 RepID=A0A1T5JPY5_9BACT|nr:hypothetical protein SAMN05660236_1352 [Ohtaekwangia koreensis]
MRKIIKNYKSSILGLAFVLVGIYLLVLSITFDYWIIGSLIIGGLMLLYSGDKFIERLEKILFGKILFKNKEEQQ